MTATGLKPGAPAAIFTGGDRAWTGYVDSNGIVQATVTFEESVKAGTRRVRVSTYKKTVGKHRTATISKTVRYK